MSDKTIKEEYRGKVIELTAPGLRKAQSIGWDHSSSKTLTPM